MIRVHRDSIITELEITGKIWVELSTGKYAIQVPFLSLYLLLAQAYAYYVKYD